MEQGNTTEKIITNKTVPQTASLGRNSFYVIALTIVAGFVEVTGYMDCENLYASIMTGNTVQLGMNFTSADWVKFGLVGYAIALFFIACSIASLIRRHLADPVMELFIMSGVLMLACIVRLFPEFNLILELPLLSLALAMQGETIARFGGVSLQTLVVTNTIVKFSDAFTGRFISRRYLEKTGQKVPTLSEAVLPGLSWLTYSVAAALAVIINKTTHVSLLIASVIILFIAADLIKLAKEQMIELK